MIVYSQGRYHQDSEPAVTLGNGGFLHGYGVFTTLRLYRGQAPDLEAHLERLRNQGAQLHLEMPLDDDRVAEVISELVQVNSLQNKDFRLRISLAGDPSGPILSLVPGPLPADLDQWQRKGISVALLGAKYQRTFLPRLKTCNYLPSMLALERAASTGCAEAIITAPDGSILEGAISNVFLVKDRILMTPEDDGRILAGQTRRRVLDLGNQLGLEVREKVLRREDLDQADELFLTNSVREVVPVIKRDDSAVGQGKVGDLTSRILKEYRRLLGQS